MKYIIWPSLEQLYLGRKIKMYLKTDLSCLNHCLLTFSINFLIKIKYFTEKTEAPRELDQLSKISELASKNQNLNIGKQEALETSL